MHETGCLDQEQVPNNSRIGSRRTREISEGVVKGMWDECGGNDPVDEMYKRSWISKAATVGWDCNCTRGNRL